MGTQHREHHRNAGGTPPAVEVRPSRAVRLVEQGGGVAAYPEPHRTPVLPRGWAPLSVDQQAAVLAACDAAPEALVLRIGSLWEPGAEYRVYRLANDLWGGLAIAARALPDRAATAAAAPVNRALLGLAWDTTEAVRLAIDFFNWDLEAHGHEWRLAVAG